MTKYSEYDLMLHEATVCCYHQESTETEDQWRERLYNGIDLTERKSINFTNVKINKKKKKLPKQKGKKEGKNEVEDKEAENKVDPKQNNK